MRSDTKDIFFKHALTLAKRAGQRGEVPIGAVLVHEGKIIAKAYNRTERRQSFLWHAEMVCFQKASKLLGTKYLTGAELYVTLEPCLMCQTAARLTRVKTIHFLLPSGKFGADGPAYSKISQQCYPDSELTQNAKSLLQDFFKKRR